ncbi:MAG: tyrosine-type recombinase/integrase [Streptosporangiaceae bacterium]
MKTTTTGRIWAEDPAAGNRRDLTFEEHRAFWTWAMVEVLRLTGMRQGEACRLGRDDIDLETGTLVIPDSKFGKSRQVFLHPTAITALRAYQQARNRAFPEPEAARSW